MTSRLTSPTGSSRSPGATSLVVQRRTGGASRAGFAVDAVLADGTTDELWLRMEPGSGPAVGNALQPAARGRGLSGARTDTDASGRARRGPSATLPAFLMRRVAGDGRFARIADPATQRAIAQQFIDQLATLHRLDSVRRSTCPSSDRPARSPITCATRSPSGTRSTQATGGAVPMIPLACAWLRDPRSRRRRLARRPRAGRHRPGKLHVRRRRADRGHRLGARALG